MYQEDLTPNTYGRRSVPDELAFGWLEEGKDFNKGETNAEVIRFLELLPVGNLYRGSHNCDFCPKPPVGVPYRYKDYPMGNGDVRVKIRDKTYVAPALLLHYIKEHAYLVPSVIQIAILTGIAKAGTHERP